MGAVVEMKTVSSTFCAHAVAWSGQRVGLNVSWGFIQVFWVMGPVPDDLVAALRAQKILLPYRAPIQASSAFRLGFSNAVHRLPRTLTIKPEYEEFYDFGFDQGLPVGVLFEAFGYDQKLYRREE